MTNREKLDLINEISNRKEGSTPVAAGIAGGGLLAIGAIANPAAAIAAIGMVIGIAGPIMVAIGIGGAGFLIATRHRNKKQARKGEA